jgi:hypothetical protein
MARNDDRHRRVSLSALCDQFFDLSNCFAIIYWRSPAFGAH